MGSLYFIELVRTSLLRPRVLYSYHINSKRSHYPSTGTSSGGLRRPVQLFDSLERVSPRRAPCYWHRHLRPSPCGERTVAGAGAQAVAKLCAVAVRRRVACACVHFFALSCKSPTSGSMVCWPGLGRPGYPAPKMQSTSIGDPGPRRGMQTLA